jgi:hypothetical protein
VIFQLLACLSDIVLVVLHVLATRFTVIYNKLSSTFHWLSRTISIIINCYFTQLSHLAFRLQHLNLYAQILGYSFRLHAHAKLTVHVVQYPMTY